MGSLRNTRSISSFITRNINGYMTQLQEKKQLKGGSRQKKTDLVLSVNPSWSDLSDGWY